MPMNRRSTITTRAARAVAAVTPNAKTADPTYKDLPSKRKMSFSTLAVLVVLIGLNYMLWQEAYQQKFKSATFTAAASTADTHQLDHELLTRQRSELVCGGNGKTFGAEWSNLCKYKFVESLNNDLNSGKDIYIVQIGAHVGFEANDPFANGAATLLSNLTKEEKKRFHWIFVEPSPPNHQRLVENLQNRSDWCNMSSINAGVVPDGTPKDSSMVFHTFSSDIDPDTGFDSRSGKTLPYWITQVSGLSMGPLFHNKRVFDKRGLKFEDYVVDVNVTAYTFSELMEIATGGQAPNLVLIDTEGFDCPIILGISKLSNYLPPYLIFEESQCGDKRQPTFDYLGELCYGFVQKIQSTQNAIAIRSNSETCS
mmetsp:Transcript_18351/g.25247  ORF Transcript_18351/g.25247 Transcript_18351/m.25247 type:complete len:368 (-) Transcript_18351:129-1232(-)